MNKGFTLIELLVVVLIIGILAAIALPQYTKAVERSRMSEAVQVLGDLATAESINFMQTNGFASVAEAAATQSVTIGDITMSLPGTDSNWAFKAEAVAKTAGGALDKCVLLTATRKQGMYKDGALTLLVEPTGAITKCASSTPAGFSDLASTAGYLTTNTCACAA